VTDDADKCKKIVRSKADKKDLRPASVLPKGVGYWSDKFVELEPLSLFMTHTAQSGASPSNIPDLSTVDDVLTNFSPKPLKLLESLGKANIVKPKPAEKAFVARMARQPGARSGSSVRQGNEYDLQLYFEALASLLRGNERKSTSGIVDLTTDLGSPWVTECIVARGALFAMAAELLRNDSIDYISSLGSVYNAHLDLVCVMLGSKSTSSLIIRDRRVYPLEEQLLKFSFSALQSSNVSSTTSSRGEEKKQCDKSASISKRLEAVAGQCRDYLRLAAQIASDYTESPEGQRKARICQRVVDITASIASLGGESKSCDAEAVVGKPDKSLRLPDCPLVLELPDEVMLSQFRFQQDAVKIGHVALARMKALVSQVVDLRTCLPDHGIWVRHGTSRCDIMKVLIMGPEGTPYQYGLYEFDLFCPAQFPKVPPKMHFCTTGGGRARFNPNLYVNGKGMLLRLPMIVTVICDGDSV
jgi:baculoviral IAP repeat-containing protein 6